MQKHLDDLAREAGAVPEWRVLLRDLDRLQQTRIQHNGKDWLVRTDATSAVTALFRQAGVAPAAQGAANSAATGATNCPAR